MKHTDISQMAVNKVKCPTCPFGDNGCRQVRASVEKRIVSEASQTCHHTGSIHGKPDTRLCRGARDFQLELFHRMGFLDEPTDEAWDAKRKELGV